MVNELQEMMRAQFTAEAVDLSRFEARIIGGCHQLCEHVQHIAGDQSAVRAGVVSLIGTVKEIAHTVNTVHQSFLTH